MDEFDRYDNLTKDILTGLVLPMTILAPRKKRSRSLPNESQQVTTISERSATDISSFGKDSVDGAGRLVKPHIMFATVANSGGQLTSMCLSGDLRVAAAGMRGGPLRVWGLDTSSDSSVMSAMRSLHSFSTPLPRVRQKTREHPIRSNNGDGKTEHPYDAWTKPYLPTVQLVGHSRAVFSVSFGPDEELTGRRQQLLSASADRTVRLWDIRFSYCLAKYECVSSPWSVSFGPFGHYFSVGLMGGVSCIYSTDRATPLRLLLGHKSDVTCSCWHPRGTMLATGSDDLTVRLWDMRSGQSVRLLEGVEAKVECIAQAADGSMVAAGCTDGSAVVWDMGSGKVLTSLRRSNGAVLSMAFSSTDAVLATGGSDCTVRLWDLRSLAGAGEAADRNLIPRLSEPRRTFGTKCTPVLTVGYTKGNLLYAGGAFSTAYAEGNRSLLSHRSFVLTRVCLSVCVLEVIAAQGALDAEGRISTLGLAQVHSEVAPNHDTS